MARKKGSRIKKNITSKATTREEKHRQLVFLLSTITGLIGFPLHIVGVWGSGDPVLQALSMGNWAGLLVIMLIYLTSKLRLFSAFVGYGVVMQTFLSAKIVYIACTMPPGASYLIIFNSFISLLVILVLMMGYMRAMPFILTTASFLTSVVVRIIRPEVVQMQFLLFFLFIELFCCVLGFLAWRDVHQMEKENSDLKDEEYKILRTFHLSKEELTAYLAMSVNNESDKATVHSIFEHMDEQAEHNIMAAVQEHETEKQMEHVVIGQSFPTLTPTEQEVCRLVMKGKTLRQIANLLGKTTNNVSAVRIHIRKKLGLEGGEDLRSYLLAHK